jgi:hypothetical protein
MIVRHHMARSVPNEACAALNIGDSGKLTFLRQSDHLDDRGRHRPEQGNGGFLEARKIATGFDLARFG